MYPIFRVALEFIRHRNAPPLEPFGTHISHHRCWPQDIDVFMEMNNGRILTLLDLGRTVLAKRVGLLKVLKENDWGLTMAGASVRYRRRIRPFQKFHVQSRALGWDDRFFYLDQSMWLGETCANQVLYRAAVTSKDGIISPARVFQDMGWEGEVPDLPDWAKAWVSAENTRPWPPELHESVVI